MSEAPSHDSLELYLTEIGRRPLLIRAEEVQLAKCVEAGDERARRRMIESNLRLVVAIAKGYRGRGVDLLDLIQEGTLGLVRAVDRYDWRRGTKFSTYASWWIRHGITGALSSSRSIRLPELVVDRAVTVRRVERDLTARLGRQALPAEIAGELGLTIAQVQEARAALQPVSSLHEPVASDTEETSVDLLADPSTPDPLESIAAETRRSALEASLHTLPERGRRVIELRFGLRDGIVRTADAVAAELGVTRQRVRQIEQDALRKLATPALLAA